MAYSHGTERTYRDKKCRCDLCVANYRAAKLRAYHKHKKLKGRVKTLVHGTTTGYNYGCRCAECTEAVNIYQRKARGGTAPKNDKPKYGTKVSTKEVT